MNTNRNALLLIGIITLAVLGLLLFTNHKSNERITALEDERNKKDALQILIDSAGPNHPVINRQLRGKIVVINVWATWCGPCRAEMPELNAMAREFHENNVAFIALDEEDSVEEVRTMAKRKIQFDYQLLFEDTGIIRAIRSLRLPDETDGIPVNMVLDATGRIKFYYIGVQPDKLKQVHDYLQSVVH